MSKFFEKLGFKKKLKTIVIVSGLPRSGTSLMMNILVQGGMTALEDNIRMADGDNPKGYFEFERVKKLDKGDDAWLPEARGKVVKIISALLQHLPDGYAYKIIFMRRNLLEILESQHKMLVNRDEQEKKAEDEKLKTMYQNHIDKIYAWMDSQRNVEWLEVNYNQIVKEPDPILNNINIFLNGALALEKAKGAIDTKLYRNRK